MSPRLFVGLVAVAFLIAGGAALTMTIHPTSQSSISCGSAARPKYAAAEQADQVSAISRSYSRGVFEKTNLEGECRDAVGDRRLWSIPLAVLGAIGAIGASVVRLGK